MCCFLRYFSLLHFVREVLDLAGPDGCFLSFKKLRKQEGCKYFSITLYVTVHTVSKPNTPSEMNPTALVINYLSERYQCEAGVELFVWQIFYCSENIFSVCLYGPVDRLSYYWCRRTFSSHGRSLLIDGFSLLFYLHNVWLRSCPLQMAAPFCQIICVLGLGHFSISVMTSRGQQS